MKSKNNQHFSKTINKSPLSWGYNSGSVHPDKSISDNSFFDSLPFQSIILPDLDNRFCPHVKSRFEFETPLTIRDLYLWWFLVLLEKSSARPQWTDTLWSFNSRTTICKNAHLRLLESSRWKAISGQHIANGIPGIPDPVPISNTGEDIKVGFKERGRRDSSVSCETTLFTFFLDTKFNFLL